MEEGGYDVSSACSVENQGIAIDTEADSIEDNERHAVETQVDIPKDPHISESNAENKTENENCEKNSDKNPEEKLCGWLQLRSRGIGNFKVIRSRWFLFGDDNCRLFIYRDQNDLVPLGEICIATASFYFDASNVEKPGLFQIRSDGKEFYLDAGNRHNMMFWLQSLQHKRRDYNVAQLRAITKNAGLWSNTRTTPASGLISKELSDSPQMDQPTSDKGQGILDLPELHITVPEESSNSSYISPASTKNSSVRALNNLKSEIQQAFSNIKKPGKTLKGDQRQPDASQFYSEHSEEQDQMSTSTSSINSEDSQNSPKGRIQKELSVTTNKFRASSFETSSGTLNIFDKDFVRDRANTTDAANLSRLQVNVPMEGQRPGSWMMIGSQDIPPAEALEVTQQKGLQRAESNSQFYLDRPECEAVESTVESVGPVDDSKAKNLMSTLRKIRIGKRQISEPASQGRSLNKPVQGDRVVSSAGGVASSVGGSAAGRVGDLEDELAAHKEIVLLLQNKLADMVKQETTRQELSQVAENDKSNIILEKTKLVEDLEQQLANIKEENKTLREKVSSLEAEVKEKEDQVAMYCDMLSAKDAIVMDLTNQIYAQDHPDQTPEVDQPVTPNLGSRDSLTFHRAEKSADEKEIERLKDMCAGYELQHKFLTKEILEMNELRKMDLAREKKLMVKLETTTATYCQVKSKYFVLLKEHREQPPIRDGSEKQEVVSRLLHDALEADKDEIELQLAGSGQHYDRYGFSRKHYLDEFEDHEEEDPLSSKAVELERQSAAISTKVREADQEASLRVKWENYMVGRGVKLHRSTELKSLIRQGIPHEYREQVWKGCIALYVGGEREAKGQEYYNKLLQDKATATGSDPAIKQIELDLLRTLPNNKHYESIESVGVIRLRRVLLAFSEYNKVIGYCQGLNRLAAIALLFLEEEEAFWCLVAIVDHILPPEYFSQTLMAAQADQRVLKDLVADKLPKVHQTLESHGVDLSLFTFNWFLTVFVDGVPTETFLRIWDTFLFEGSKVLFRFAIAFLKMVEGEIVQQKDSLQLNRFLRRIGDKMTNIKQISQFAFGWINPFPMGKVASRRQQHLADIRVELKELDKLRHGLKASREQQENEYMSDDDLDS